VNLEEDLTPFCFYRKYGTLPDYSFETLFSDITALHKNFEDDDPIKKKLLILEEKLEKLWREEWGKIEREIGAMVDTIERSGT